MANESIQLKMQRESSRPPRVRISYDVHVGDATKKVELPFIVGVMGDFSGDPTQPLKSLADRKFTEISRDNFDKVMAGMNVGLNLRVKNTLQNDGTEMGVQLKFNSMKDFQPANIVEQIDPLRDLLDEQRKLKELMAKISQVPLVETALQNFLLNEAERKKAGSEAGNSGDQPQS